MEHTKRPLRDQGSGVILSFLLLRWKPEWKRGEKVKKKLFLLFIYSKQAVKKK